MYMYMYTCKCTDGHSYLLRNPLHCFLGSILFVGLCHRVMVGVVEGALH